MARGTMTAEKFHDLEREAQEVAAVMQMPGWAIISSALTEQMDAIRDQLAENRLRTIHETVGGTTTITTAETQIAENAGMYKMGRWLFTLVETILAAPQKVTELERTGTMVIIGNKPQLSNKGGETDEQ